MGIDTGAAILAGIRLALLDIIGAGGTRKAQRAGAGEGVASGQGGAGGTIPTGRTRAQILCLAVITWGWDQVVLYPNLDVLL